MSELVDRLVREMAATIADAVGRCGDSHFAELPKTLEQLPPSEPVSVFPQPVVDRWLQPAIDNAPQLWRGLARLVGEATPEVPWLTAYENLAPSADLLKFQPNYSFMLLAAPPFRGYTPPVLADDLLLGCSIQAPNVMYPAHHHAAPEIYGIISGTVEWQVGDTWATKGPGDVIIHRPHESHAMRTGADPLLTWAAWPFDTGCHVYMPSLDPPDQAMDPVLY